LHATTPVTLAMEKQFSEMKGSSYLRAFVDETRLIWIAI
jgi:hypothetical protein